jgi:hypothetical protein
MINSEFRRPLPYVPVTSKTDHRPGRCRSYHHGTEHSRFHWRDIPNVAPDTACNRPRSNQVWACPRRGQSPLLQITCPKRSIRGPQNPRPSTKRSSNECCRPPDHPHPRRQRPSRVVASSFRRFRIGQHGEEDRRRTDTGMSGDIRASSDRGRAIGVRPDAVLTKYRDALTSYCESRRLRFVHVPLPTTEFDRRGHGSRKTRVWSSAFALHFTPQHLPGRQATAMPYMTRPATVMRGSVWRRVPRRSSCRRAGGFGSTASDLLAGDDLAHAPTTSNLRGSHCAEGPRRTWSRRRSAVR